MKFQVTYKTPDAAYYACQDLQRSNPDIHKDDISELVYGTLHKTTGGSEYITVEFDTDANTAVVVKA
jgi:hypothetical protein